MKNEIKQIKSSLRLDEVLIFDYNNDKYMDTTRISKTLGTLESMSYNAVNRIPECYNKYVSKVTFDEYDDIRSKSKKCVSIRLMPILLLKMHSLSLSIRNELWIYLQKEAYNQVFSKSILDFTDEKGKITELELPEPNWELVKWSTSKVLSNVKHTHDNSTDCNNSSKTIKVDFRANSEMDETKGVDNLTEEATNTLHTEEIHAKEASIESEDSLPKVKEPISNDLDSLDVISFLDGFTKIAQEHSLLKKENESLTAENESLKAEITTLKAKIEEVQANPAEIELLKARILDTDNELKEAKAQLSDMINKFSFAKKYVSENLKK